MLNENRPESKITYYVGHDVPIPSGGRLLASPLSEQFQSRSQVEQMLQIIRNEYPDAYGIEVRTFI